jgi:hypothetical protein
MIANQPPLLEPGGDRRHAGAAHSQHRGQELVGEEKRLAACEVMGHQ